MTVMLLNVYFKKFLNEEMIKKRRREKRRVIGHECAQMPGRIEV